MISRCLFQQARTWLSQAKSVTVLTGAGISAESGVPTFRGAAGLWKEFRPEDLATPRAFARDPKLVWEWYDWRRSLIARVEPNPGHFALAELERCLPKFTLVTQNVDGLHQRAGRCIRARTSRQHLAASLHGMRARVDGSSRSAIHSAALRLRRIGAAWRCLVRRKFARRNLATG